MAQAGGGEARLERPVSAVDGEPLAVLGDAGQLEDGELCPAAAGQAHAIVAARPSSQDAASSSSQGGAAPYTPAIPCTRLMSCTRQP